MSESATSRSKHGNSELLFAISVVSGLAAVAAIFYWLGSHDRGFQKRKAAMLFEQLTHVTDARKNQSRVEQFVSYSMEADTAGMLMDGDLEHDQWLQVARQRAEAICTLVSMGDIARSPELAGLCSELARSNDPKAQEIGQAAQCALDFENQFLWCKHKSCVDALVELASDPDSGEPGQALVDQLRKHLKSDWRMASFFPELQKLASALPEESPLTSQLLDSLSSQLLETEELLGGEPAAFRYDDWVQQAQDLVAHYPHNGEICRAILDRHDRLTKSKCFDEAKQLLDAVIAGYAENVPPDNRDGGEFVDRQSASEIQLDRWRSMIGDNPADSTALIQPMVEGAKQLQDRQLISQGILERFISVAEMMEQTQQYDSLSRVRDELSRVFAANKPVAERFQSYCAASSKRAAMVGKPFSLPSAIAVGESIDPAVFDKRVTAVVFWSGVNNASLEMLKLLDQMHTMHKNKGFGLIAINVDQDVDAVRKMVAEQPVAWKVVNASALDATGNNPLAVEYGIQTTPYLILVDTNGIVVDVALSVREMWERAGKLMPSLVPRDRRR